MLYLADELPEFSYLTFLVKISPHCSHIILQKVTQSHSKESSAQPAKPVTSKRRQDEDGRVASTPKRKKTDGSDPASSGGVTPGSSTRKVC